LSFVHLGYNALPDAKAALTLLDDGLMCWHRSPEQLSSANDQTRLDASRRRWSCAVAGSACGGERLRVAMFRTGAPENDRMAACLDRRELRALDPVRSDSRRPKWRGRLCRGALKCVNGELWAVGHMGGACGAAVCGCTRLRLLVACVVVDFVCFCVAWCM